MTEFIHRYRILLARRSVQLGTLLLFVLGFRTDWTLWGLEPLVGDLSASRIFGVLPLADPFAALQILATGNGLASEVLIGSAVVAGFYYLVGGRAFCGWVCPMNLITDGARRLRTRLGISPTFTLDRRLKYGALALSLGLSALMGIAAFEWISPISLLHRELIYGMKMGWLATVGIFLFDLLLLRNGWCGHLCPLGAFYSLVGYFSPVRVRFNAEACDRCGICHRVCPEPQVLNLKKIEEAGMILSGNCTNCGNCIGSCPQTCLSFSLRFPHSSAPGKAASARELAATSPNTPESYS